MKSYLLTTYIVIFVLLLISYVNFYYPLITNNFKEINKDIISETNNLTEIEEVNKFIEKVENDKKNAVNANALKLDKFTDLSKSIYAKKGFIDDNNCYIPTFRLCNKKEKLNGYEIFTPFQQGCMYPDEKLSAFNTAFSQVDKYLNTLPHNSALDKENNEAIEAQKDLCAGSDLFKDGVAKFGLCDENVLINRYKLLKKQKNDIINNNNGFIKEKDINTGLNNMNRVYKACFGSDIEIIN